MSPAVCCAAWVRACCNAARLAFTARSTSAASNTASVSPALTVCPACTGTAMTSRPAGTVKGVPPAKLTVAVVRTLFVTLPEDGLCTVTLAMAAPAVPRASSVSTSSSAKKRTIHPSRWRWRGSIPVSSSIGPHPFTAPARIPCSRYFWPKAKISTAGSNANRLAAMVSARSRVVSVR